MPSTCGDVARVACAVQVGVGLIGIEVGRAVVTIVADEIPICIELDRIGYLRAIVFDVLEAVEVGVVASGRANVVRRPWVSARDQSRVGVAAGVASRDDVVDHLSRFGSAVVRIAPFPRFPRQGIPEARSIQCRSGNSLGIR